MNRLAREEGEADLPEMRRTPSGGAAAAAQVASPRTRLEAARAELSRGA